MYSSVDVDALKLASPMVRTQGAAGNVDAQLQGVTASLSDTIEATAKVAEVVNEQARQFQTHHEGIAWCVKQLRRLEDDIKLEIRSVHTHMQRSTDTQDAASRNMEHDRLAQMCLRLPCLL